MKKLMIALAVVAVAAGVQAASFTWKTKSGQYVYQAGTTSKLGSGTAYVFDAGKVSQSALLTAWATDAAFDISTFKVEDAGGVKHGALDHQALNGSSGITAADPVSYGSYPNEYSLYFALVSGDQLYISDAQPYVTPSGSDAEPIQFSPKTSSQAAALDAGAGYKGAGWYSAVPEPTSGLLLLLGVAGLALRRRRA